MSKTPFTREHRETLEQLLQDWDIQGYAVEAVRAALENLAEPEPETLPDGLYLYAAKTQRDGMMLRFVRDGRQSITAKADLSGPKDESAYTIPRRDLALYQPVSLIVRTSDGGVEDAAVSAVHRRLLEKGSEGLAHFSYSAVRGILQALPHGVVGR